MKAYIVVQDADGREIHLPLDAYDHVQALVRPGRTEAPAYDIAGKFRLAGKSNKRTYSPSFVDEAVSAFLTGTGTVEACARRLGIPGSTLDKWIRDRCGSADRDRARFVG